MTEYMKAVDIRGGTGPATALFINDHTPKPKPGPGEVIVKVVAFGLNRMDLIQRVGEYPVPPQAPATLGVEFSGTVESLGDGVEGGEYKLGDAVFGLAYGGAYAQYVAVSTKTLLHKPDGLTWEQAAGVPETWITATQALFMVGEFHKGQRVLWHAGASGVSIAGIQLSKRAGAGAVYATAGSDEKCRFIEEELGATKAFNYHTDAWAKELSKATNGEGVDEIIDFIGASYLQDNLNVAAQDGHIVGLGQMSGSVVKNLDIHDIMYKRLHLVGSTLRSRDAEYQGKLRDKLEEYVPLFVSGELKIFIDKVMPWENIVEAHELMEKGAIKGKIICLVSQE